MYWLRFCLLMVVFLADCLSLIAIDRSISSDLVTSLAVIWVGACCIVTLIAAGKLLFGVAPYIEIIFHKKEG